MRFTFVALIFFASVGHAREVCQFIGSGSYGSEIRMTTQHESHPDNSQSFRTLISVSGLLLWYRFGFYYDEQSDFDSTKILRQLSINTRQTTQGKPRRQKWDQLRFLQNENKLSSEGWRIQGKKANEFAARYLEFSFWPLATFGEDWISAFDLSVENGRAERRTDLDVSDLSQAAVSPGWLLFYLPRILQKPNSHAYDVVTISKKEKIRHATLELDSRSQKKVWLTHTSFSEGELAEPIRIEVNSETGEIDKMNLSIDAAGFSVDAELISTGACQN